MSEADKNDNMASNSASSKSDVSKDKSVPILQKNSTLLHLLTLRKMLLLMMLINPPKMLEKTKNCKLSI